MELQELIENNNLQLRTQEEISTKFDELQTSDGMFDFRPEVLVDFLTFDNAKSCLYEEYVKEVETGAKQWEQILTIEKCAEDFLNYMKFAWGKAEDKKGLSASRSVQKLGIWLWVMNRDDLRMIIEDNNLYNPYGAPALVEVCDQMGIEVPNSLREFAKVNQQ